MRGDGLLDALEHIDPELIREADRRPGWIRWTAVAACLAVLVGLGLLWLRPGGEQPGAILGPTLSGAPVLDRVELVDYTVHPEKITGWDWMGADPVSGGGAAECPPAFAFNIGIVAEARVVEILPDMYRELGHGSAFHILKLEILDVVSGKNVPKTLYLRLEGYLSPELDRFDSLLLSMEQVGLEDHLMVREDGYMVSFPMMFRVYHHFSLPHYGSVLAFTDGSLDLALWELDGWEIDEEYLDYVLGDHYIADEGDTAETVKEAVRQQIQESEWFQEMAVYGKDAYPTEEARQVFSYVQPLEHGTFRQSLRRATPGAVPVVFFTRKIDGFDTSEQIRVDQEGVTYQGEAFTQEELARMPDLAALIAQLRTQELEPPHIQDLEGKKLLHQGIVGKYFKVAGQVYGVVRVSWEYHEDGQWNSTIAYYDAVFYLVGADGSYQTVEREAVRKLVGEDTILWYSEYGVGVELAMQ